MKDGDGYPDGVTGLRALGQSVWLDDLGRHLLDTGALAEFVREGVSGVTSNPAIFAEAFASHAYDGPIRTLAATGMTPAAIAGNLVFDDVGRAADLLRPVFDASGGVDGFVSIEVAPRLAYETEATVAEAHRLREALGRPNVMIKVPGTEAGVEALRRLTGDGVPVNVTLLFTPARHAAVLEAYAEGLEERVAARRGTLPASVASFFLSRIDSAVDVLLDARHGPWAPRLRGMTAIASAMAAHETEAAFRQSPRWRRLAEAGARPQRLLWASTGVKDPAYSSTRYVEALALPGTVTTLSRATFAAALAIGRPQRPEDIPKLEALSGKLAELAIDLAAITRRLEAEGIAKFVAAAEAMTTAIADRMTETQPPAAAASGRDARPE